MTAKTNCIPCILDDVCGALESLGVDESIRRQVMKDSLEFLLQNIDLRKEPSVYITEVHRILKRVCGVKTPFARRREICNKLGLELEKKVGAYLCGFEDFDKFSMLARWSISANALDFRTVGTGYDFDIAELESSLQMLADRLEIDQLAQIYEKVRSAKRILFVHDNVGEIALDKPLIRFIQNACSGKVISAVRGGPITSDATMDDAVMVKLNEVSATVILTGPDTLGVNFSEMSEEFKRELSRADLLIAKGQANYYVFSEHKNEVGCPIVCLFRTKCKLVSGIFNAKENINVAVIL